MCENERRLYACKENKGNGRHGHCKPSSYMTSSISKRWIPDHLKLIQCLLKIASDCISEGRFSEAASERPPTFDTEPATLKPTDNPENLAAV